MIKGLAITPPIVGRISIGRVVERNGQRLPAKDDQFTQHGLPIELMEKVQERADSKGISTAQMVIEILRAEIDK